jgi:large subunit ribosomal protein L21
MRYAIVESGGKQYKAVEGETIEVDRLPDDEGAKIELQRILLMADGDDVLIGTPTTSGIEVRATVLTHSSGRKVTHFKYSPKKRIRVRGGHRQQYTQLLVDFIGRKGESRKVEKPELKAAEPEAESKATETKRDRPTRKETPEKAAEKKATVKKSPTAAKSSGTSAGKKSSKSGKR